MICLKLAVLHDVGRGLAVNRGRWVEMDLSLKLRVGSQGHGVEDVTGELAEAGGSRDRTMSPAAVSRKREYLRSRAETFGDLAGRKRQLGR
jgi:hypothetical protein